MSGSDGSLKPRLKEAFLPFLLMLMVAVLAVSSGCTLKTPPNTDWSAPDGGASSEGGGEAQEVFDAYARALVEKDREEFLSLLDGADPAFFEQQARMFDSLLEVPFARYEITVTSLIEPSPGMATAKVETSFTYAGSFPALPDPDRSAYTLTKREDGWKISGDATEQALGKAREAGLEDFAPVRALVGDRVIVLFHASEQSTAERTARLAAEAFPRLDAALPGVNLPRVPVRIFGGKDQIDRAFPGKWTEWTGGASRQLGEEANQGGEIIIDARTFGEVDGYDSAYNPRMIAHELTHVALFPLSGPRTPPFLIEGLADYVAGEDDLRLLKQKMRGGESFSPTLDDLYHPGGFSALLTTEAATLAYEQSDAAVQLLEDRYGNGTTLRLIREFRRRGPEAEDQDRLVDEVFLSVLGAGWNDFEEEWRRYVLEG